MTVEQFSTGIKNNKVGVTTVGKIKEAGGEVVPSPSTSNPNHATLSSITPAKAEELFNPTIPNQAKKI